MIYVIIHLTMFLLFMYIIWDVDSLRLMLGLWPRESISLTLCWSCARVLGRDKYTNIKAQQHYYLEVLRYYSNTHFLSMGNSLFFPFHSSFTRLQNLLLYF